MTDNNQEKLRTIPGMDCSSGALAAKSEGNNGSAGVPLNHKNLDFPAWGSALGNNTAGIQLPFQPTFSATQSENLGVIQKQEQEPLEQLLANGSGKHPQVQEEWQVQNDLILLPKFFFPSVR